MTLWQQKKNTVGEQYENNKENKTGCSLAWVFFLFLDHPINGLDITETIWDRLRI